MKEEINIVEKSLTPKISVRPMTIDEEFSRICWYIRDANFFQEHKYNILLPTENPLFIQFYQRREGLKPQEETTLKNEFKNIYPNNSYDKEKYSFAINEVFKTSEMKESVFFLQQLKNKWGFMIPDEYLILLTKYGGGGSYDIKNNTITYNDNQPNNSKLNFIRVALHEAMHIGIEEKIIRHFNLNHLEKERIVDLMCKTIYAKVLSVWNIQKLGEVKLDQYIKSLEDIEKLPEVISNYLIQNPRKV